MFFSISAAADSGGCSGGNGAVPPGGKGGAVPPTGVAPASSGTSRAGDQLAMPSFQTSVSGANVPLLNRAGRAEVSTGPQGWPFCAYLQVLIVGDDFVARVQHLRRFLTNPLSLFQLTPAKRPLLFSQPGQEGQLPPPRPTGCLPCENFRKKVQPLTCASETHA